jgi:hypothetical protein
MQLAKSKLCVGVALACRFAPPSGGLAVIPPYTPSVSVHQAEPILCPGVPLLGCFVVPMRRLAVTPRDAVALPIHSSKGELGVTVALPSR